MVHGQADYGAQAAKSTTYSMPDMGELAARLGSPVTLDRRGDVIFYDKFDNAPLRWEIDEAFPGDDVRIVTDYAKRGEAAVRLLTDSTVLNHALIRRYWELPRASNIGIEVSHTLHADITNLVISADLYDGTRLHYARIAIHINENNLKLYTTGGAWPTIVTPLDSYNSPYMWYTPKLVWDWENKVYKRLIWNGVEYDISAYATHSVLSAVNPHIHLEIQSNGAASGVGKVYIDEVIYTQNEP